MAEPIVYGAAYSTYSRSVLLALEEKGVAYRFEVVDFLKRGMPPEQLARHPFAKVPAFEHDGFRLYETSAIIRYVDEVFAGPPLQPAAPRARARMNQIISVIDSYAVRPAVQRLGVQRLAMPALGRKPDEAVIAAALPMVERSLAALEALVGEGPYAAGERLSLADLYLIPVFDFVSRTPEGKTMLADKANLRRWWESVRGRESVARTEPGLG
ncbi:MAG: glutathione S-transferase family protein [Alphaproteobacteria bacterium]|nr:glutathione S-transferase family protein [Alphaproteobacteria bacterium]